MWTFVDGKYGEIQGREEKDEEKRKRKKHLRNGA